MANNNPQMLSPNSQALHAGLPVRVKAVAYRNKKNHFFVPSKTNYFGGIQFEYVMDDNGCNSTLPVYPFKEEVLARSPGMNSNGRSSTPLVYRCNPLHSTNSMRFHLGTESATLLQNNPKLSASNKDKLTFFLTRMGDTVSPERKHVLLGNHYLRTVVSIQRGYIFLMCDYDLHFPTVTEINAIEEVVEPLLDEFEDRV